MFEVFNANTGRFVYSAPTEDDALWYCNTYSKKGAFLDYEKVSNQSIKNKGLFNIRTFKVGGVRWIKIGRINISFCVSRQLKGF